MGHPAKVKPSRVPFSAQERSHAPPDLLAAILVKSKVILMLRDDGSWSTDDPDRPNLSRDMEIVGDYPYDDGEDRYLYSKIKGRNATGKAIRTGRLLGGNELQIAKQEWPHDFFTHPKLTNYQRGDGGLPAVLYRLTKFKADCAARPDDLVFIPEGEGDVDTLHGQGQIATTNPNGAGKWRGEFNRFFLNRDVAIPQDNDGRGKAHARMVAEQVSRYARSVKIIELPGLDEHGDVSDYLRDHSIDDLLGLVESAAEYEPEPSGDEADAGATRPSGANEGVRLEDFHAFMPSHNYIFAPNGEPWPASSVNARIPPQTVQNADGEEVSIPANRWLDRNRPVEQMVWAPGRPQVVKDRLISEGGWIHRPGCNVFNQYRPPAPIQGNPTKAGQWLDHVRLVYPGEADHIVSWLAHQVQRPDDKTNHALVLGGPQGIGKDTLLEPVKAAVGPWNFSEVSPQHIVGRFNGFVRSVILRVSEARDLGDVDRFAFYDHMKTYTAAPPDVLRVDEKFMREYSAFNVCGVIITSNHKTNGIYLPEDDRRHFVAWSDLTKDDFTADYWKRLWDWYSQGGIGHVAAYLAQHDLTGFQPKGPPPKTEAFWDIVASNSAPEDDELSGALDKLGSLNAVTLGMIATAAESPFGDWLRDHKNARKVPHKMEECGYRSIRNPNSKRGRWKVRGKDMMIYARKELSTREAIMAAEKRAAEGDDVAF